MGQAREMQEAVEKDLENSNRSDYIEAILSNIYEVLARLEKIQVVDLYSVQNGPHLHEIILAY